MKKENKSKEKKKIVRRSKRFLELVDLHIIELMVSGLSPALIEQELIDNYDFATDDNARKAIRRVNAKLADANKDTFENKCAKYLEMQMDLYKKTIDAGELRTANQIMDSMIKLQNLTTTKIQADINANVNSKIETITIKIVQ